MSNVSIYEKNWTDLVFEDKNKAYGAYQLRQENPRTTLLALFSGIVLIIVLLGSWMLLSSFGNKVDPSLLDDDSIILKLSDFNYPKKEPETPKALVAFKKEKATEKKITKKDLQHAILVKENPDEVRTNKEMKENLLTNNQTDATATISSGSTGGTATTINSGTATTSPKETEGTKTTNELDRLPEFPGTMKKFYAYVEDNIRKPEVDDNVSSMNVIMSFVIEKDGTMTDIKAMRSSDKNLEREAIRVLKALKIKWSPGYKDGEKVRTLFMLPIKVAY